jgi:hypothetical protein
MKALPVLLALGMLHVALPLKDGHLLTSQERHMVLCVQSVIYQHFEPGLSVLIVFPSPAPEETQTLHTLAPDPSNADYTRIIYFLLHTLSEVLSWPLEISCVGCRLPEILFNGFGKHNNYIIFTWAKEGKDIMGNLFNQMEEMKKSSSWNSRARFLVVVTRQYTKNASLQALEIAKELWNNYKVADIFILNPQESVTYIQSKNCVNTEKNPLSFGLYTWIPYQSQNTCAEIRVFLIEECPVQGKHRFFKKAPLFPVKIPKQFHQCPLKVSVIDTPPALAVINTLRDEYNNTHRIITGVEVQYLQQLVQLMNATLVYQEVPAGDAVAIRLKTLADLESGLTDLTIGGFPLHLMAAAFADPTISHLDDNMVWYVPCGGPNSRMERIMKIFTPSLWMALCITFILAVVVMWGLDNTTQFIQPNVPVLHASTRLLSSIYIIWSVTLGISVSKIPKNYTLRTVFICFVWYSFAISCVFQTYFTSILVNPGMSKQITTLEELYQSSFVYHYNNRTDAFIKFTDPSYNSEIRLERKECLYRGVCIIDYLNSQDVIIISSSFHAEYYKLAALPIGSLPPPMCALTDKFYNIRYTIYIAKGSFLVDSFNRIIRQVTEAGLIDKMTHDAKTNWRYENLSNGHLATGNIFQTDKESGHYFVFSMSHLKVAFYLLALGYVISILMIIGELLFSGHANQQ